MVFGFQLFYFFKFWLVFFSFFSISFYFRQDNIIGVSECIIMGVPIPIGTGIFKLVHKVKGQTVKCEKRERLLDTIWHDWIMIYVLIIILYK